MIDYYDSAEELTITRTRALREVEAHDCDAQEFLEDMGDSETYLAQDVLSWIGY